MMISNSLVEKGIELTSFLYEVIDFEMELLNCLIWFFTSHQQSFN